MITRALITVAGFVTVFVLAMAGLTGALLVEF